MADAPKVLWAPWRMAYLSGARDGRCPLCSEPREADERRALVLARGAGAYVIGNRYPYGVGHVLVVPDRHVGGLLDLTAAELAEMTRLELLALRVLGRVLEPDGFNIGMNLGSAAGAGVPDHVHRHVVPRWQADTNFMPVVGEARVLGEHLLDTYDRLRPVFDEANAGDPSRPVETSV